MTDLIRQAEEVLPENWEDIADIIHLSRDNEETAIIADIQLRKLNEYESSLEEKVPVKRGKACAHKRDTILKRQKKQWK